ncbi:MAG: polysaccharide deacetylase family protein [Elusimicrobia bacterium]|nr:polysaccharide deacetylase family protein [Elusimicrobiota bacterium]
MRRTLKNILYDAFHASGLTGLLLRKNRRHVPVLLYHGVADRRWPGVLDCERKHVRAEDFERHLVFLKENFQVVRLTDYAEALCGRQPLPKACAVITFDDGYADNHSVALPLLRKHGLPATVFLAADFVVKGAPLWVDRLAAAFSATELGDWTDPAAGTRFPLGTDAGRTTCCLWVKSRLKLLPDAARAELLERICLALRGPAEPTLPSLFSPLTREQVREMAGSGLIDFGSHGLSHAILTALPAADARREIAGSKKVLEEFCGGPVLSFAYPNGDYDPGVARLVQEAGYACAVTGGLSLNEPDQTDRFAIRRVAFAEGDSVAVMAATVCGLRGRMIALAGGR